MNEELKQIESGLTVLEANQKQIKMLKNKANYITNELEIFENNYIKSNWSDTKWDGIYGWPDNKWEEGETYLGKFDGQLEFVL